MRMLVLGAGALGGYIGGKLLKAGVAEVDFLVRPGRAEQLREHGLMIREPAGSFGLPVRPLSAGALGGAYDVVLLACKSYDLDSAIEAVAPAVGAGTAILPFLNGIRHIKMLTERFGRGTVLGGATVIRVSLLPDGTIERYALPVDFTHFGELDGERSARCQAILQALAAAGIAATLSEQIVADMWRKFFGFAVTATVTTLLRARAGEIAAAPAGTAYVGSVLQEVGHVVAAEGYPHPPEDEAIIHGMFGNPASSYGPSILADVESGKRTEGDHTVGDIVRRAEARGLDAPLCRAAWCHLQIHEQRRQRHKQA